MTLADYILQDLDREMPRTRKLLERVPADKMDFSPGHGFNTIGWNANHLASIVGWPVMTIEKDELDIAPAEGGPSPDAPGNETDPAKVLALFDDNLAQGKAAIAAASDGKLAEPWSLKAGGQTLFTMPRGDVIRTWVLTHVVHHTAILSVHLRLAGVEVGSLMEEMPGTTA